jgi:hypothetical protein
MSFTFSMRLSKTRSKEPHTDQPPNRLQNFLTEPTKDGLHTMTIKVLIFEHSFFPEAYPGVFLPKDPPS